MRWLATVYYRTDAGIVDVQHEMEEIGDLQERIERGPHWDTIANIVITRINHNTSTMLTVEQAEKL